MPGAAFHDFLEQVRSITGVQSATLTEIVPLSQDDMDRGPFVIQEKPGSNVTPAADYRDISPGYFQTMRIPLLQGRSFAESDDAKHPRVAVIDQTLARGSPDCLYPARYPGSRGPGSDGDWNLRRDLV